MQRSDYLIRRIFFALATLVAVIVFNFFLFRILPGDPVKAIARSPRLTGEARERLRADFGLDKPVFFNTERLAEGDVVGAFDTQFTAYVRALLHGNLGISYRSRRDVAEVLAERVWRTVVLVAGAETLALLFGVGLGLASAWRRGTRVEMTILLWALISWGLPNFFLGIILLLLARGHLPVGGMATPGLKPEDGLVYWADVGRHLILPTLTMAIVYTSSYILIMRSSVV
ncbi:MAG: ABC transporter permease subunit, partial [Anaerolineae bacterium]|nr:ABC transporter permease subunit [Anaerolineae bacterium]NIQ82142.1 ABC transporter permease subunit [Anaerolineae bacterium]